MLVASNAISRDVAGDQNAVRDSPGIFRMLGASAHNQYVVPLRTRSGVLCSW